MYVQRKVSASYVFLNYAIAFSQYFYCRLNDLSVPYVCMFAPVGCGAGLILNTKTTSDRTDKIKLDTNTHNCTGGLSECVLKTAWKYLKPDWHWVGQWHFRGRCFSDSVLYKYCLIATEILRKSPCTTSKSSLKYTESGKLVTDNLRLITAKHVIEPDAKLSSIGKFKIAFSIKGIHLAKTVIESVDTKQTWPHGDRAILSCLNTFTG